MKRQAKKKPVKNDHPIKRALSFDLRVPDTSDADKALADFLCSVNRELATEYELERCETLLLACRAARGMKP